MGIHVDPDCFALWGSAQMPLITMSVVNVNSLSSSLMYFYCYITMNTFNFRECKNKLHIQ